MDFINLGQSAIHIANLGTRWLDIKNVTFDYSGGITTNTETFSARI